MEPTTVWGMDKPLSAFSYHQWKLEEERVNNGISFFKFETDLHVSVHGSVIGKDAYGKLRVSIAPDELSFIRHVEGQGWDTCKKQLLLMHPGSSAVSATGHSMTWGDTLLTVKATKVVGATAGGEFIMDHDAVLVKGTKIRLVLCFSGFYHSAPAQKCGFIVAAKSYVLE